MTLLDRLTAAKSALAHRRGQLAEMQQQLAALASELASGPHPPGTAALLFLCDEDAKTAGKLLTRSENRLAQVIDSMTEGER